MRSEDLDGLAQRHPECIIAAYADIEAGITLLTNSDRQVPREALDELCAEAALTLGSEKAPPLGALPSTEAVKADETAIFVYLRAADEPSAALICMCRPSIELPRFLDDARACLGSRG